MWILRFWWIFSGQVRKRWIAWCARGPFKAGLEFRPTRYLTETCSSRVILTVKSISGMRPQAARPWSTCVGFRHALAPCLAAPPLLVSVGPLSLVIHCPCSLLSCWSRRFEDDASSITHLDFTPSTRQLVAGCACGSVLIYALHRQERDTTVKLVQFELNEMASASTTTEPLPASTTMSKAEAPDSSPPTSTDQAPPTSAVPAAPATMSATVATDTAATIGASSPAEGDAVLAAPATPVTADPTTPATVLPTTPAIVTTTATAASTAVTAASTAVPSAPAAVATTTTATAVSASNMQRCLVDDVKMRGAPGFQLVGSVVSTKAGARIDYILDLKINAAWNTCTFCNNDGILIVDLRDLGTTAIKSDQLQVPRLRKDGKVELVVGEEHFPAHLTFLPRSFVAEGPGESILVGTSTGNVFAINLREVTGMPAPQVLSYLPKHLFGVDDKSPILSMMLVEGGAVVRAPAPTAVDAGALNVMMSFVKKLKLCSSLDELESVGKEIKKVKEENAVSESEVANLRQLYVERRAALVIDQGKRIAEQKESPRKSDDGGSEAPQFIIGTTTGLVRLRWKDLALKSKVPPVIFPSPVLDMLSIVVEGKPLLMCITQKGRAIYRLSTNTLTFEDDIFFQQQQEPHASRQIKPYCLASDGTIVTRTKAHGVYIHRISTAAPSFKPPTLFVPSRVVPPRPKEGILSGLFSSAAPVTDRQELFGKTDGPHAQAAFASRISTVAAGDTNIFRQLHQKVQERTEKLDEIGDKAEELKNSAGQFEALTRQLMEQEKNRKWWEF
eukprot:m.508577 g.508577  ORF g.508577 m.508577 type:complete len:787 (+) comp57391_c0_seq17:1171-3531(+)